MKVASRTIVQIKPEKQKEVDSFMKDKAGQISSIEGLITWGYINTGENEITVIAVYDNQGDAENATPYVNTVLADAASLVVAPPVRNIYEAHWY